MEHFVKEFTTIFYLTDAANSGKSMSCVLSEDTDVLVLLVGVSGGGGMQGADGAMGHDSAGPQCLQ